MVKTRQILLENFDEEVQDKLRIRAEDSRNARSRFERMLIDLTRAELSDCAAFDDDGCFTLLRLPDANLNDVKLGRYELPRRSGDAHLYRINHPLALWITGCAKTRILGEAKLVFDYDARGMKISTLEPYRGKTGWLTAKLISVEAFDSKEEYLLIAASTADGQLLEEDDPEKLLRLPAHTLPSPACGGESSLPETLAADVETRKAALLREINQRNLGYFEQEVQKLDAWADDLKLGLEQEIKEVDREIKEVRRAAAISPTLEEKLSWQKAQRELEGKRSKLRRELFARQDEIEAQRNDLISALEMRLQQQVEERELFTIEWELA
jgi:hypothetical protein